MSGASAGRRLTSSRANTSVPVWTARVAGLASTATVFDSSRRAVLTSSKLVMSMRRPHLGRAGARALIMLAILAAVEAVNSRAEERPSARLDASAAPANHLSLSQPGPGRPATPFSVPAPFPEPGQHQPVQPVVPVGRQSIHVPILMYHYIRVNPNPADRLGFDLSVTPEDFNSQMDWLAGHGYHPIDFNDLRAYFAGQRPLPERPVIVTLDDGYRDLYTTAYPILRAHG